MEVADSKTYTVHLEPDQNLQEIRAKVESLPEGHVILLAPSGSRVLRNVAAMRLVRRTVSTEWAVAIVSPDSEIQSSGRRAGLSVHRSFGQASHAIATRQYVRHGAGLGLAGIGLASATGLGIAMLIAAVFVFGTWTEVTLEPMSRQVEGKLTLDLTYDSPAEPGGVPAREHTKILELGQQVVTTGVRQQVQRQAEGIVTFANRRQQAITIPAGTSVWSESGVRFFTSAPVDLPVGVNSKIKVNVIAEEQGELGNLPRLSITEVDAKFVDVVSVFNEEATQGGGMYSVSIVTANDMAILRSSVLEMARQEATAEIVSMHDSDAMAILALSKLSVIDEQFSHKLGEESKKLHLRSQIMVRTPVISSLGLRQAVSDVWNKNLPGGWSITPTSIEIVEMTPEIEGETAWLIVASRGRATRDIIDSEVVSNVRLKPAGEARQALIDRFPLASTPLVSVHPKWPGISVRVNVHIMDEGAPQPDQNAQN